MDEFQYRDLLALVSKHRASDRPIDFSALALENPGEREAIEQFRSLWELMSRPAPGSAEPTLLVRSGPDVVDPKVATSSNGNGTGPHAAARANSELRAGATLGKYVLERRLGGGGQGVVWLAQDTVLSKSVALKFLPEWLADDEAAMRRLRAEAKALDLLTHEHIVKFHTLDRQGPWTFLDMQYLSGPTLSEVLTERKRARAGALLPEEVVAVLEQVAAAIDYAHKRHVLHLDLKPGNLMLTERTEKELHRAKADEVKVRVTDFGLAFRIREAASQSTTAAYVPGGTLGYIAPEILRGQTPTERTDIYSLGATLYHLISGELPFAGADMERRIQEERPPRITTAKVPREHEEAILQCLEKDPDNRPASGTEVLRRILYAPPPTRAQHPATPTRLRGRIQSLFTRSRPGEVLGDCEAVDPAAGAGGWARRILDKRSGLEFQLIEPGSFLIGSADGVGEAEERPRYRVEIRRPYYLSVAVVTVGQWRAFTKRASYATEAERGGSGVTLTRDRKWLMTPKAMWKNPLPMLETVDWNEEHPVTVVSWHDVQDFCKAHHYRLPTEAEWEYACRAGTDSLYWWGNDARGGETRGNFADRTFLRKFTEADSRDEGRSVFPFDDRCLYSAPVRAFLPNPWGLFNVLGNVWEWCQDCFQPDAYEHKVVHDPLETTGPRRVLRGGSFADGPTACRSAFRGRRPADWASAHVGFRPLIQL